MEAVKIARQLHVLFTAYAVSLLHCICVARPPKVPCNGMLLGRFQC
jgi:hypothetical protein